VRIAPFELLVPDEVLADLHERLARTRWPALEAGPGWEYGVPTGWLRSVCASWASFDWRAAEARLNQWPQFIADLGDTRVHFVHARSAEPRALPLVLTVGWPSTFAEVLPVISRLTNPAAHGDDRGDAFHVVVPTYPGFGFSQATASSPPEPADDTWAALMEQLGYHRFVAAGSDWGADVVSQLGRRHPDQVLGLHFSSPDLELPNPLPENLTPAEQDYLARLAAWQTAEGGYAAIQRTKPQTVAYGLSDSPVGQAAWILEKFRAWADDSAAFGLDDLLTAATIAWVTNSAAPAARVYHSDPGGRLRPGERIEVPTGVLTFPAGAEPNIPRSLVERSYRVTRWTDAAHGGHFPTIETPGLLANELRAFARPLRASTEEAR
jgi:pimeloyl-ACP methyl ester carboxylesterase